MEFINMRYGFFCERNQKPSEEQIAGLTGNAYEQWAEINSYLTNIIKAKSSYKFYGRNYGWALGYTKNSKSIISLYPLENYFTIQIIVKKDHEIEIRKITDNKELWDLIKKTTEIHEGKWIFIKYSKINSTDIIKKLIDLKIKTK